MDEQMSDDAFVTSKTAYAELSASNFICAWLVAQTGNRRAVQFCVEKAPGARSQVVQ
jgi:hypothetical protein